MGEKRIQQWAEPTALRDAGIECKSRGAEVIGPTRLRSVSSEEVKCPVVDGGADAKITEFCDEAGRDHGGAEVTE